MEVTRIEVAPGHQHMQMAQVVGNPGALDEVGQVVQVIKPPVPIEEILASLQGHSAIEIIEKAQVKEIAANLILELLDAPLNYDSKNRYNIRGQSGEELFYAMETSSLLERTLGWSHALDVVYTEGGSAAPLWKMRGDRSETAVANAATDETEASISELTESWCCPVKSLSRFGCHGGLLQSVCRPIQDKCFWVYCCCGCCCCQCWCELCVCCFNSRSYLFDPSTSPGILQAPLQSQMSSESGRLSRRRSNLGNQSTDVYGYKTEVSLAIIEKKYCTIPWICVGCIGEGSDWIILKDAKRDRSQEPLVVWHGQEIGTLRRKGKGFIATCCLPAHDSDHWKLNLSGTKDSKDKLAAVATVLFMDFANIDQQNES